MGMMCCKGGLDRAGILAAWLLVELELELGLDPAEAMHSVRRVCKGVMETPSQRSLMRCGYFSGRKRATLLREDAGD